MNLFKNILLKSPEYLLIIALLFYWLSSAQIFNPIAISLMIILAFQIIFEFKVLGFLIPSLLIVGCLFMLLAVISEFNEFPIFNYEAKRLLFVGLSFFISTIVVSGVMIYKYSVLNIRKENAHPIV